MEGATSEESAFEPLATARASLAALLPPQAYKILHALQHVELALQYSTIDGRGAEVLAAARNALKLLNLIEKRRELPPAVGLAVSRAVSDLAKIVRAARTAEDPDRPMVLLNGAYRPDRRGMHNGAREYAGPRRRNDDTVDALACLDENLLQVG